MVEFARALAPLVWNQRWKEGVAFERMVDFGGDHFVSDVHRFGKNLGAADDEALVGTSAADQGNGIIQRADRFDATDAAELWDLVNKQDWAICESVQRGMSSRSYRHGWFAPMEDDSLDIRRWLLPRLDRAAGGAR